MNAWVYERVPSGAVSGSLLHHHTVLKRLHSDSFELVARRSKARYLLGLSATVSRKNSLADAAEKCEAWLRDDKKARPHSTIGNKSQVTRIERSAEYGPCRL